MFAIHASAAWHVAPGSRSLILCLVRRMNTRALRLAVAVTVVAVSVSCASTRNGDVPNSEAKIRRLLVGRWYHVDSTGELQLPHRFEVTFAGDGTCRYSYIPKDPALPRGITDGTWQLAGRSLVFQWTPRSSLASKRPIADGPIYHLDPHRLEFRDPLYGSISVFYRSYRESLIRLPPKA